MGPGKQRGARALASAACRHHSESELVHRGQPQKALNDVENVYRLYDLLKANSQGITNERKLDSNAQKIFKNQIPITLI